MSSKKKCFGCEHMVVKYWPIKHVDTGLVVCDKHDLVCDFVSKQHLKKLTCVEEEVEE